MVGVLLWISDHLHLRVWHAHSVRRPGGVGSGAANHHAASDDATKTPLAAAGLHSLELSAGRDDIHHQRYRGGAAALDRAARAVPAELRVRLRGASADFASIDD